MLFSTGNFPSDLKITNIISIFKKDVHALCNNYHPISSWIILAKLLKNLSICA